MNKQQTRDAIKVMQAYVDGEEIEVRGSTVEWIAEDLGVIPWQWSTCEYRIKPKPREFWINPEADDSDAIIYEAFNPDDADYIKVREVLDEGL